jgi:hypothetical protein
LLCPDGAMMRPPPSRCPSTGTEQVGSRKSQTVCVLGSRIWRPTTNLLISFLRNHCRYEQSKEQSKGRPSRNLARPALIPTSPTRADVSNECPTSRTSDYTHAQ